MLYFIFGGFAWLMGLRILEPQLRSFMFAILSFVLAMSVFIWLHDFGSVGFSGVWTPAFGLFLLRMLVAGAVGLGFGTLMRFPRAHNVRTD